MEQLPAKMHSRAGVVTPTRLSQYKTSGHDWKEVYRKRCLTRLREKRTELFARRRSMTATTEDDDKDEDGSKLITMVMSTELKALHEEEGMDDAEFFDPTTGEIDMTLAIIEDIQEEMKAEEAKLIEEYEIFRASLEKDEAALCSAIEMLHTHPMCPVCTHHTLMENKGIIFCKCGVRINTEQDHITLDFVQTQLDDAKAQHDCDGQPVFAVKDQYGITNLLMTCQKCDYIYIII